MTSAKKKVVIGILGTRLDAGAKKNRWEHWRPTVSICQHESLLVDRLELLVHEHDRDLARQIVTDIGQVSPETAVRIHLLPRQDVWDFEAVFGSLHDFASSYDFQVDDEEYFVHITTGSHVQQICLFLLTESRHLPGQLLQTSPDRKNVAPHGTYSVIDLDLSKYDALAKRFEREQADDVSFLKSGIETRSTKFNRLMEEIERVAVRSAAPILLMGPTGAGKSKLAKQIYALKRKKKQLAGPLVEVNCATLRGDQAMSTLFGHVKGAFTGATNARPGLLKSADGGLLFLDEIGELGLDEQAMLLRALEEKLFLPVGADKEEKSSFQLIAGTNRDLRAAVAAGNFREDLLARIHLWSFVLPGLAERREDIEPNFEYELERFAEETGRKISINKEAREKFLAFAESPGTRWNGNFRDLNAAVKRMATLCEQGRITVDVVAAELERLRASWHDTDGGTRSPSYYKDSLPRVQLEEFLEATKVISIDPFDRVQLEYVIEVCQRHTSLSAAGRELFAASRSSKNSANDADRLRKYLLKYGLNWKLVAQDGT